MKYIEELEITLKDFKKFFKELEKIDINYIKLENNSTLIISFDTYYKIGKKHKVSLDFGFFEENLDLLLTNASTLRAIIKSDYYERIKDFSEEQKKIILSKPSTSIIYNLYALKKRVPEHEREIANNSTLALNYAINVLKSKWENSNVDSEIIKIAKKNITTNPITAFEYFKKFGIKDNEESDDDDISKSHLAFKYFIEHKRLRWLKGEKAIFENLKNGFEYISTVFLHSYFRKPPEPIPNELLDKVINIPEYAYKIYNYYKELGRLSDSIKNRLLNSIYKDEEYAVDVILDEEKPIMEKEKFKNGRFRTPKEIIFKFPSALIKYIEYYYKNYDYKQLYGSHKEEYNFFIRDAEKVIIKNANASFEYAKIIGKRFKNGEEKIIKSPTNSEKSINHNNYSDDSIGEYSLAIKYANEIIKDRWPELEHYILKNKNVEYIIQYANDIIKGRWKDAEEIILNTPEKHTPNLDELDQSEMKFYNLPILYVDKIIGDRWSEYEKIIKEPYTIIEYAIHIIKDRWKEKENIIFNFESPDGDEYNNPKIIYNDFFNIEEDD